MKTIIAAAALALSLAACSQKAQDESTAAANTMAADTAATTRNAVDDVQAASDAAFAGAEQRMDKVGARIDNAADVAANRTGDALENAGAALKK